MDIKSQDEIATLHPKLRDDAMKAWMEAQAAMPANVKIVVTQGYRTFAESDALYAQGRTKPGSIVTNAKAGESYHNYGLAFDFAMTTNGREDWSVGPNWLKVVEIMKKHGWSWGGDFKSIKDNPHFEKIFGYNWKTLKDLHNKDKLIPNTSYVQI